MTPNINLPHQKNVWISFQVSKNETAKIDLDVYFSLSDLKILFYETAMKNLALFWAQLKEWSLFRCCS